MAKRLEQFDNEDVRIGMLGAGFMARMHSQGALLAGASLDAIASSGDRPSEEVVDGLGYRRGLSGPELIQQGLPVVHICTPNNTHAPYVFDAFEAGSNVICEKPLTFSISEARAIVELAEAKELRGAVPFVYRYHPMVREARARIHAGKLGEIFTISGQYLQDWLLSADATNWRVSTEHGGPSRAFADIGSHLVDLIEFVTGDRIVKLFARMLTVHKTRTGSEVDTEDAVTVTFEMRSGAIGNLLVSQVAPGRKNALGFEISGSESSLQFNQEKPEELWAGAKEKSSIIVREPEFLSEDAARLCNTPAGHPQGYQDAFNAFVADAYKYFSGGIPEGIPTLKDGLRAVQLTEYVLESARKNMWVEIESHKNSHA